MQTLYQQDLAYIQAVAFGDFARGAAPEIIRRLRSAAIPIRRVLDVGCGAGPLTAELVAAGFDVAGIDPSADLLVHARAAVPDAQFFQGSVHDLDLPDCEAILAVGEPLTYGDAPIEPFLAKASAVLPPGGLLIFDVIELGSPSLDNRFWRSGDDWAVLSETQEDQAARTLVRTIETFRRLANFYRRAHEIHRVQVFDAAALCAQLAEHGFWIETAQAYGDQPLPPRRRAFLCARL
jgi:SAM-dependent methyltransferase